MSEVRYPPEEGSMHVSPPRPAVKVGAGPPPRIVVASPVCWSIVVETFGK
jgi:hypothetical protein